MVESSWNVMAYGEAREGKWRGNWRMEWVASTLHTTSEHGVSSITTADAHTSAASSRLNWRPCRFAERRNLVSARVPSHFRRSLQQLSSVANQYCCLLLFFCLFGTYRFDVHMSVHRKYISKVQPTRCNVFSIYLFLEINLLLWQYLTLYVQFCAPDDGRRNRLKHVEQFIEINRSRKPFVLLVVL